MLRIASLSFVCFLLIAASVKTRFGGQVTLTKSQPLQSLTKNPEKFSKAPVLTSGTVAKACEKKGCWMVIKDGDTEIRVTFEGYSFFVPLSIVGKKIRAQGRLETETQSVAEQRHLLEDANASPEEIAKVKTSIEIQQLVATAVEVIR